MKNTKNKISSNVSKELGISKESKRFVNVFVKIMKEAISQKTTKINNFGTFYKKQNKEKSWKKSENSRGISYKSFH